jgi:hypothetical protein
LDEGKEAVMRLQRILFSLCLAGLLGLSAVRSALAFPPLPASFYGQVKLNGGNTPEGTLVRALINGQPYAEGHVKLYQGDSVYSLDVRGDDADSSARDGGVEGDVIQFEVGGVLAAETGPWHSGTNVALNLTLNAAGPLQSPPPTLPSPPTQTPVALASTTTPETARIATAPAAGSNPGGLLVVIGLSAVALMAVVSAGWIALRQRE